MYIKNGIAYAGDIAPLIKVCSVRPLENYKLWLTFNDGTTKIFDFSELLKQQVYSPLNNVEMFNSVSIDCGVPVWNDGKIDIAPEYLYNN